MHKEVRQLIRQLGAFPGVRVEEKGHHARVFKDDRWVTTLPSTPSDRRWYKNTVSVLRKAGIDLLNPPVPARKEFAMASTFNVTSSSSATGSPTITVTPTSQFYDVTTTPQPKRHTDNFGKTIVSISEYDALRARLIGFLDTKMGYPGKGAVARFARHVMDFQKNYEGRGYKTFASAEVSIWNMINKRTTSVSDWVAELLDAAMDAYDPLKEAAAEVRYQRSITRKRSKNLKAVQMDSHAPQEKSAAEKLREELQKVVERHRDQAGISPNQRSQWGRSTLKQMAQIILREAALEDIKLRSSLKSHVVNEVVVSKRISEYLSSTRDRVPEQWMQDEIANYIRLYKKAMKREISPERPETKAIVEAVATVGVSVSAKQVQTLDVFFNLIEDRALNRSGLQDAYALAEMQATFENSHPRG